MHFPVLALVFAIMTSSAPARSDTIAADSTYAWNEDWNSAFAERAERETPLLVYFTSKSCPACRIMEQETFAEPTVRERLEQEWTCVRIYGDRMDKKGDYNGKTRNYLQLAKVFRVIGVPTFVFFDREGEPLQHIVGARDEKEFGAILDYIHQEVYKKGISFKEFISEK